MLDADEIILVDLVAEFFPYLRERFAEHEDKLRFYETTDAELDAIDASTVDFVFSFGVFVHVDPPQIADYLGEIQRVLRPGGIAVLQYADKRKDIAARSRIFSDMTAARLQEMVDAFASLTIRDSDEDLLAHSNIAVIAKQEASGRAS